MVVAALAAVALVVVLIATQGGGGGDDDDQASPGQATTTAPPAETTTTEEPVDTTTSVPPGGSTPAPLPGDDWNDEARVQFVGDCAPSVAAQVGLSGDDANGMCGCVYDRSQDSGVTFGEFNEAWAADDLDTTSPAGSQIVDAMTTCTLEIMDGA
jgi:hypothetical protein